MAAKESMIAVINDTFFEIITNDPVILASINKAADTKKVAIKHASHAALVWEINTYNAHIKRPTTNKARIWG